MLLLHTDLYTLTYLPLHVDGQTCSIGANDVVVVVVIENIDDSIFILGAVHR